MTTHASQLTIKTVQFQSKQHAYLSGVGALLALGVDDHALGGRHAQTLVLLDLAYEEELNQIWMYICGEKLDVEKIHREIEEWRSEDSKVKRHTYLFG